MAKEFEYIKSKVVNDTDGFLDDYTMYKRLSDGKYIMIFGDTDMYTPENTEPDAEFDTQREADEWFNSYGEDESIDPEDLGLIDNISFDDVTKESKGKKLSDNKSLKEDKIEGKFSDMAGQIGLRTCKELEDFLEREGYAGALETLKSIMLDYLTYELDDLDFIASESKSIKDRPLNESLARYADTDAQEESINAIERTLASLGIKVRYGTKIGKYPQTVILDIKYQDNAIYIISDGRVLISGDNEGKVNPKDKKAVKQMLIDYGFIDNGINESWKDFAFVVKCNDGPKELVRVVADNRSKAEEYAKKMYAQNHTTYADDRHNVWSIEDKNESLKESSSDDKLRKINILYRDAINHGIPSSKLDKILIKNGADPSAKTFDVGLKVDSAYEELTNYLKKIYKVRGLSNIPYNSYEILGLEDYFKDESLKESYQNVDSMSREELMGEIDDIYYWALKGKHIDITSIIEDPEVFNSDDSDDEEGYFKGVPTNKLRGILKILRKMKDGGSLTHDDVKFMISKDGSVNESNSKSRGKYIRKTLSEDTIQKKNGKWTNRGKDGQEHGEFDTKEEADAQRKAMFARGFKG